MTGCEEKPLFHSAESARQDLMVLAVWALVVFWVGARFGDLRGDPLMYAVISKDMALNNHWLTPNLLGQPYINKPPLFLWIMAFFFKLFGASVYVSKLPSLIFSTLDVFMLYFLALKWFGDRDIALFTAFSFMTTRWVIRNFASTRPESLLIFGLLTGLFALSLMLDGKKSGPYLLGSGLAVMVMTKFTMAAFLAVPAFLFIAVKKKPREWLWRPHFYAGLFLGGLIPAVWILYYGGLHPGYFGHMLFRETIERITDGTVVHNSYFLYLKEVLSYYYPWLIFFIPGAWLIWKKRQEGFAWLVLAAVVIMGVALQVSAGKMGRYLIPLTPLISMITAHGAAHFASVRRYARKIALYAGLGTIVFFWSVPVRINPLVYHTVHIVSDIETRETSYVKPFAFLGKKHPAPGSVPLVEWDHPGEALDYAETNYFFLPKTRTMWNDSDLQRYARAGRSKIFLIAPTPLLGLLPCGGSVNWTKVYSDEDHTLLIGVPSGSVSADFGPCRPAMRAKPPPILFSSPPGPSARAVSAQGRRN